MSQEFSIQSHAKLNLCLDVLEREAGGMHKIQTIFCEHKDLCDTLKFYSSEQDENQSIEYGEDNLALKALRLVKEKFNINKNLRIEIEKNIPPASGLGGGSSNAAATLKALNELWGLGLDAPALEALGAELGMDVPFFIRGGWALGSGHGEKLEPLPPLDGIKFTLLPADHWPSPLFTKQKTAQSLAALDLSLCGKNVHKTRAALDAIKAGDAPALLENLHNDFETLIKTDQHLSGSGPAVFKAELV